jgi:hypothetical protein
MRNTCWRLQSESGNIKGFAFVGLHYFDGVISYLV